jgi:hypothetical protein
MYKKTQSLKSLNPLVFFIHVLNTHCKHRKEISGEGQETGFIFYVLLESQILV